MTNTTPFRFIFTQKKSQISVGLCAGKLFCPHYPHPPNPGGSPGVRGKMCVMKKGGALKKRVIRVFIKGGARQK